MGNHYQVELKGATKVYGEVAAIRDVDLSIERGEFFSILGPSGSGKTTILKAIAGLISLSSGEIWIGGRSMHDVPAFKRGLSIVFQNYALFPHMNVFENVAFGLRMNRVTASEIRPRVLEALERVRLPGMEKRKPHELSGGQQQRVALARAIVTHPKVMLLDEPLGALDKSLREEMQIELKILQRQLGITTIMVTHDQEEALSLSDRIAVINGGCIEQVGKPNEIYEQPINRFVAQFIGGTNLFSGVVEALTPGGIRVKTNEGLWMEGGEKGEKIEVGDHVYLTVRPEKIRLSRRPMPEMKNQISGMIENIIYMGASTLFHIGVGGRRILVAEKNAHPEISYSTGETIFLSWPPSAVRILKE